MKVAALVSGGVDSSVALKLAVDAGHDVTAFYLKIWLEDELAFLGDCPWEEDMHFAREVCAQAGVNLEILNLQAEYLNTVVEYTIRELKAGRTPSPDIMCNKHIKFGEFFKNIAPEFELAVSGHYAQIERKEGLSLLRESPDPVKDQTYFLTYLNQKQLNKIEFPIGKFTKPDVRQLAHEFGLATDTRPDSQGICFLGKIKYNDFIKFHLGEMAGDIVEIESGKLLGKHKGFWFHTIGQRQGLGLSGGPWYVVRKDIKENIVYVSRENALDLVPHNELYASDINWISGEAPESGRMKVKLRHGPNKYDCSVTMLNPTKVHIKLDEPDQGISPGQFAILYHEGYCLGGGIIELAQ